MFRSILLSAVSVTLLSTAPGLAQTDPGQGDFIGQVKFFGTDFCPQGTIEANGQLLPRAGNLDLFRALRNRHGGQGLQPRQFGVPDLRNHFPAGNGRRSRQAQFRVGDTFGGTSATISVEQLPAHSHGFNASSRNAESPDPTNRVLATFLSFNGYAPRGASDIAMSDQIVQSPTSNARRAQASINIQDPGLTLTACVVVDGIIPQRRQRENQNQQGG